MIAKIISKSADRVEYCAVLTEEEFRDACDEYRGFCIHCGEEADRVEPDARAYTCEECGANGVYGYEELLLMGGVELSQELNEEAA